MQPIVRKPDAGENHRRAAFAERGNDGNRATGPRRHRAPPHHFAKRLIERLERGVRDLNGGGIGAMQELHGRLHILGREPLHRRHELTFHGLELLVRDEPQAHLRGRHSGYHGFRPVPREPAQDAVDLKRGERPQPLQHGVPLQPGERLRPHPVLEEVTLPERQALPGLKLALGGAAHGGVEARNIDLAVRRLELRQQADQLLVRVGRGAAELAGVEVRLGGAHRDLGVAQTPQRGVDRRPLGREVRHVGDEHHVSLGALGLAAQQLEQHAAAVLFLAFDQEAEVDGRVTACLDRLEQAEHLAFVVGGAAGEHPAVANGRFERRRAPLVERIGRLHVVVAVDEERGRAGHFRAHAPHDRMRFARDELHLAAAEASELAGHPFRRRPAIGVVRGEGRDRGDAEEGAELAEQTIGVHEKI